MISIKKIAVEDLTTDKLFAKIPSVFHSPHWLKIYNNNILLYGLYNANNECIGSFFLFRKKISLFSMLTNPPFTPNCGLFYINPGENITSKHSFDKKVLTSFADFLNSQNALVKSIALPEYVVDTQPFFWKNFKVIPHYTYQLSLNKEIDNIYENFSPERKKSIRKAIKDGITVEKTDNYQLVFDLVLKTFSRKEKKINAHLLHKILFNFSTPHNSFAFTAYQNNIPIAAAFCLFDKHKAYYLLGGYDNKNKHHGAGPLCMLECIKYAQNLKLPVFDFEGSMLPEVEKYFRDFGGELKPYYTIHKAAKCTEILLKFVKPNIF